MKTVRNLKRGQEVLQKEWGDNLAVSKYIIPR